MVSSTLRRRRFRRTGPAPAPAPAAAVRIPQTEPWKAPDLRLVAPDPAQWPFPEDSTLRNSDARTGWWIMYVLDTGTGELTVRTNNRYSSDGPDLSARDGGHDPRTGVWVRGHAWDRAPGRIGFPCAIPRPGIAAAARDLQLIAPYAERLLTSLQPVPGTADCDWTIDAVLAHQVISHITNCEKTGEADLRRLAAHLEASYRQEISFGELIRVFPELPQSWPTLAAMPDTELDALAVQLISRGTPPDQPADEYFTDPATARQDWYRRLEQNDPPYPWAPYPVGVRAGLHELRAQRAREATGYTLIDAQPFLAANPGLVPGLTADMTDSALERAAGELTARVAWDHHLTLAGAAAALTAERTRLRARIRAELAETGETTLEAEARARQLRTARAGLVARVIAWDDPADRTGGSLDEGRLADLARMPREALSGLRARLALEDSDQ